MFYDFLQKESKLLKALNVKQESDLFVGEKFENGDTIVQRIQKLQLRCGHLCDTNKPIIKQNGDFLGTVQSKIDCIELFAMQEDFSESATLSKPPLWNQVSTDLKTLFTYQNRVEITQRYFDESRMGGAQTQPTKFTIEYLQNKYMIPWEAGKDIGKYEGSGKLVSEAADFINVTDKSILVIGTQNPWIESILLTKKAKKILTLEYGYFESEHPALSFIRPKEFKQKFLNGTLGTFDVIISYSSLEHSGLGRYGDPLNPWGDILAMAEAWCVSSPQTKLLLGVPTSVSLNKDWITFNAHRVYGPLLYPFLTTNWKFVWPLEESKRNSPEDASNGGFQPVFIFEKK